MLSFIERINAKGKKIMEKVKNNKEKTNTGKTKNKLKVEEVVDDAKKQAEYFKDEYGDVFAKIWVDNHFELMPVESKDFEYWLIKTVLESTKIIISKNMVNEVVRMINCHGRFYGATHRLFNRAGVDSDGVYWIDLANEDWEAVKIGENGWEVVKNSIPVYFRRYKHQKAQVEPSREGDVKLFDKFLNIKDEKQKLLLYVHLLTSFIPDIPHTILSLFGTQGSAKSTLSKMLRSLIDNSKISVFGEMNKKELIQTLNHNWVCYFDNVGTVRRDISNLLCSSVTGAGFTKRTLFTDEDDVICNFNRVIGVNGISNALTQPDIAERSILIETQAINPNDRQDEQKLWQDFESLKPRILGGAFDVLSQAMRIKPTLTNTGFRMADFALWGEAIAQAMGYSPGYFSEIYRENMDEVNRKVLDESEVGAAIVSFMKDRMKWEGTPTDFFKELTARALNIGLIVNENDRRWVQGANALSRKLNELKPTLYSAQLEVVDCKRKNSGRKIMLINKYNEEKNV